MEFINITEVRHFNTGDVLRAAGEFSRSDDFVIILLQGSVAVNKPHPAQIKAPEVVSEYGYFSLERLQEQMEVAAVTPGMLAVVLCSDLDAFMEGHPDSVVPLMQVDPHVFISVMRSSLV